MRTRDKNKVLIDKWRNLHTFAHLSKGTLKFVQKFIAEVKLSYKQTYNYQLCGHEHETYALQISISSLHILIWLRLLMFTCLPNLIPCPYIWLVLANISHLCSWALFLFYIWFTQHPYFWFQALISNPFLGFSNTLPVLTTIDPGRKVQPNPVSTNLASDIIVGVTNLDEMDFQCSWLCSVSDCRITKILGRWNQES